MNTKAESYIQTLSENKPKTRQNEILEVLKKHPNGLTAREILHKLHKREMNYVRPRITELIEAEKVIESGKKYDKSTNRNVHIFKVVS